MTIIQIVGCKDIYFLIFNYLDAVIRNFFSYMRIKVIIYNMYIYSMYICIYIYIICIIILLLDEQKMKWYYEHERKNINILTI